MKPKVQVWLVNGAETEYYPVYDWHECTLEQGRFTESGCSLVVGVDSPVVLKALGVTVGQEFWRWQLWVSIWNSFIFRGPVRDAEMQERSRSLVKLSFEGHLLHALRRRVNWTSTKADVSNTAAPNTTAITLIDRAMGITTGPVYPTGYPGGGLSPRRTEFGGTVYKAGVATGAPAVVQYDVQGGGNLASVIEELCLLYDMVPILTRNSAASYQIDIAYPFQKTDTTASLALTPLRGSATEFSMKVPYTLTTVARVAGSGSGATQNDAWSTSGTATYGVYEDQVTDPGATSLSAGTKTTLLTRLSSPPITFAVKVRDTSQVFWPLSWGYRDKVRIYSGEFARGVDRLVVGYKLDLRQGGRTYDLEVTLAEPRFDPLRQMAGRTGVAGGWSGGDRWRDKRG